jgi:hypothetical protein
LRILQRGNRLSITPVDPRDWEFILGLLNTWYKNTCSASQYPCGLQGRCLTLVQKTT